MLALCEIKLTHMSEIYQRNKKLEDGRINGKWFFFRDPETDKWRWRINHLTTVAKKISVSQFDNIQDCIEDAYLNGYPKRSTDLNFPVGNKYLLEVEVVENGDLKLLNIAEFKINYLAPLVKNKTNKNVRNNN